MTLYNDFGILLRRKAMIRYADNFIEYLINVKKTSGNTVAAYRRDIGKLIHYLENYGVESLEHVSFTILNSYVMGLERMGNATASISRNVSAMKSFFSYLFYEKIISNNPALNIKPPKIVRNRPEIITVEEMEKLLECPDMSTVKGIRDKAMLELLYATGIKVSEIINMTLKDVNLTMKFVTCADDERGRIIPFGSMAGIALKNYIDGARNNLNPEDDILFPNCDGKKMTRQGFWKIVKQYGRACGLEDRLTPHIFRNSFAAHMIEGGADLKSIQEMLGHADISTTQNYAAATHVGISSVYSSAHPRK